jgi:hypothetical protein
MVIRGESFEQEGISTAHRITKKARVEEIGCIDFGARPLISSRIAVVSNDK